jgi:membrane fusion protein (multidrug efflux system)
VPSSVEDEARPLGALRAAGEGRAGGLRRPLRQRLRLPLMILGPLVVVLAALYWYLTGGRYVSTDDAYVQAARVQISTDVSGRVVAVAVRDNQRVAKGQLLFELDPRPFHIAVASAKAQLAAARLKIEALKATYRQKLADAAATEATLAYQQRQFGRQQRLLSTGAASQAQYDQASHNYELARQQLAANRQDLANVLASLGGNPDIPIDQHPEVQQAQAALDHAALNLSYTSVHAPESGVVTKVDQLQVGDYVTAGTPLFSLLSSERVWVEANFKETELTHMRPGQKATVAVDTYPDVEFPAHVESLSPGTGLTFALLPAENATGNWVKVVQRLPVRFAIERRNPEAPLAAGLSATVTVDTGHRRPWLGRIEDFFAGLFGTRSEAAER